MRLFHEWLFLPSCRVSDNFINQSGVTQQFDFADERRDGAIEDFGIATVRASGENSIAFANHTEDTALNSRAVLEPHNLVNPLREMKMDCKTRYFHVVEQLNEQRQRLSRLHKTRQRLTALAHRSKTRSDLISQQINEFIAETEITRRSSCDQLVIRTKALQMLRRGAILHSKAEESLGQEEGTGERISDRIGAIRGHLDSLHVANAGLIRQLIEGRSYLNRLRSLAKCYCLRIAREASYSAILSGDTRIYTTYPTPSGLILNTPPMNRTNSTWVNIQRGH